MMPGESTIDDLQRAMINILGDLKDDRDKLERTQRATLNILEDFDKERKATASLAAKEILLKEVHHRVKNNLQIIASLLSLQAANLRDPAARAAFADSRHRVKAMGLVHETLYRSTDLARLDLEKYLRALVADLVGAYADREDRVTIRIESTAPLIETEKAVSLGLIANELVTNALKHAFPGSRRGTIVVRCEAPRQDWLALTVEDDGVGIPEEIDLKNTTTLGMQIITSLAGQLDGVVTVDRTRGTRMRLDVPLEGAP
ncbi:MAG: histidine kinase dimerization/phosphoacceptor domain -containing protein [Candidatus Thermoplasmatota archaeon]